MTFARVHLLDSDVPLKEGEDRIALCGVTVPRAIWAFMWSEEMGHWDFSLMGCCAECLEKTMAGGGCHYSNLGTQYVYGLIPGESLKQQGEAE